MRAGERAISHSPFTMQPSTACCLAENSVYMKLEKWILAKYGVEPRGWYEPDYTWQEQQRPGSA